MMLSATSKLTGAILVATLLCPGPAGARTVMVVSDPEAQEQAAVLMDLAVTSVLQELDLEVIGPAAPTPQRADALVQIQQAVAALDEAKTQFDELEIDSALQNYSKAQQTLEVSVSYTADMKPLARALSMLAATNLLLGLDGRARSILESLLVLDPEIEADGAVFNPQMMEVFDAVRQQVAAQAGQEITIESSPANMAVLLDGELVGFSPVKVAGVRPGRHFVSLWGAGHEISGQSISVESSVSGTFTVTATPAAHGWQELAKEAIAEMDEGSIPAAAKRLASDRQADEIVLVRVDGAKVKVVKATADGSERQALALSREVDGFDTARTMAKQLLGLEPIAVATADDVATTPDEQFGVTTEASPLTNPSSITLMTYGGAGVLAVGGGVMAILAYLQRKAYMEATVQVEAESHIGSGKTLAIVTDVLFGAAIVTAAVGAVFHVTGFGNRAFSSSDDEDTGFSSELLLGPNSVGFTF